MSSDLLDKLIKALTVLPGVGKKSAQRMALYLLDKNKSGAREIASSLNDALDNIQRCKSCRMLTTNDLCHVCQDETRDSLSICVVESPSDLLAIDIKQAIYFLGELTGEISNDEVLGNIFSKFCIGK